MDAAISGFLDGLSSRVFWIAAIGFVVVNGAAIAAFATTRSRRLVNEWTGKLVAIDAVLLGAGLGVPLLSGLAKIGVHAVASLFGGSAPTGR
ncbi:MAG TPA: hypothetical protein VFU23_10255 [Gemmatimonadales bacterium]|nr:hypothetical protein [Gemmatimonadales bacterium]